ncbi:MAG: hypothetical protein AAGC55_00640, partial [Myxococcota bacterium]
MSFKHITDRQNSARQVIDTAKRHAVQAHDGLNEALSPHLQDGESMPDMALLIRLVGRWLDHHCHQLVAAGETHRDELADDKEPRRQRDEAFDAVRSALVDLRDSIHAIYGRDALGVFAIAEPISSDPAVVISKAQEVITALRSESVILPEPKRRGMILDRSSFASEIALQLPNLWSAMEAVARETREAESTLAAKREAMAAYDQVFERSANLLEAAFAAAGLKDQADRVRPSGRRSGRTSQMLAVSPDDMP